MSVLDQAVIVTTKVSVDWEMLGEALSGSSANDQGYFLVGWWQASTDEQAAEIAKASILGPHNNSTRAEVAEYLRLVADAIDAGGS